MYVNFTECPDGTYGNICSLFCSLFCINGVCNKVNGHCTRGCKAGYQKRTCDQDKIQYYYFKAIFILLFSSDIPRDYSKF